MESGIIGEFNKIKKLLGFKEPYLKKSFVLEVLVSEYNALYEECESIEFGFDYKRQLEDQGILIETIASRLGLTDEFEEGIIDIIRWKK